ncbi:hypothetical protein F2Q69_00015565 [Brassica cretica]|uniref:Uncharacterized protein n=1 Tax=Brassica cretica TaxID=69181 RepID=A0A8S9QYV8_BRACR|nr:hypothetical protein F2Q69_00015565 [Brassica cretica]
MHAEPDSETRGRLTREAQIRRSMKGNSRNQPALAVLREPPPPRTKAGDLGAEEATVSRKQRSAKKMLRKPSLPETKSDGHRR